MALGGGGVRGLYIALEGADRVGKSTQVQKLVKRLKTLELQVVETQEPGGTPLGAEIRRLVLQEGTGSPLAELFLFLADRAEHQHRVLEPALRRGAVVVSDRSAYSTVAYQGILGGLGADRILHLHDESGLLLPDLAVVLDMPEDADRWDDRPMDAVESRTAQEGLRHAYREMAHLWPDRIRLIDADGSARDVAQEIWQEVWQTVVTWREGRG